MELPSMVQRSGNTLIVRSVVSGNQLYLDQGANSGGASNSAPNSSSSHSQQQHHSHHQTHNNILSSSTSALEQQLERYRIAAAAQQQHYIQQQQQQQHQNVTQSTHRQQSAVESALELKDEGLPQCKIKRNYSCSYCTYFTQNPRCHLTHLRDVHGEKIVINKCKLCLYASRHFQKLVRHMKMVHGCTDGIAGGGHGQARGKRGMSREARKRKLEQSVGASGGLGVGGNLGAGVGVGVTEMPTLEQVKRELELQEQKLHRDIQAFNKQQEEQKQQQAEAYFAAYERTLQAQHERELEELQARNAAYEMEKGATSAESQQRRQHSPTHNSSAGGGGGNNSGFQMPAHQHIRNLELTPSPSGSASPLAGGAATPTPTTSAAFTPADDLPQNRLLKCSICEFTTLYRAQLVDHELEEHHKTKFFRCEKCTYVTHIKARFSKHVKYHSMPMIKCVTCDFRTPYKWNLDRHMKNHGGAGPFKCAACDFTADIKQSLTVHEMNHHVPPVGHAAGMSLARRRNKVGGTDLCDDFLSDSAELLEDHYNNNNMDDYDEALGGVGGAEPDLAYGKKCKYDDDEPTDLSQKGGSSDTSSVHNHQALTPKAKRPMPNLIPIPKVGSNVLNLSKDLAASRSSLTEIASMFFNEKQLSEMAAALDKSDAAQLSPTTTITSTSSHNSRSLLHHKKPVPGGSFFDKLKSSALASGGPNENLICPCGHMAKCLSESIIHRKTCNFSAMVDDDIEEEQDDGDGRLEIDFVDDEDKQSHSALNLSVSGSTRCQHCRHRCKSSADLLNHLKQCSEAGRCGNESYDSMSGDSSVERGGGGADSAGEHHHPMENRVFIWNKMPRGSTGVGGDGGSQCSEEQQGNSGGADSGRMGNGANDENSYYGVETAPGYGEMTAEEEAANSSLKKVYKCPHCSFWASTASRFHVHIVGHLNKKPFECSLCSYRSNWRWDITKHIRLKTIRDPSHKNARVLMNDETGRRNYTKYNKYITLMKVTEEDGDPKLMKSGEMTPNQVASLAFLNDFNNKNGIAATAAHLNGGKEDVTLEPIAAKSDVAGDNALTDGFIRLPMIATMMNAAMAQQQQSGKEHQDAPHTTMITPSVTISAVKRSPPPLMKPSDDLITDVKQEGNEKKTYYKCRKCSFRHANRDAVLAHVKIHYQDANYPIVTATVSPKSSSTNSQQHTTPLQVAVNSNLYMNKVFAAMCLSQQQQQQHNSNSPTAHNQQQQQQQQHSILSASGLLQQAIQSASPNSPLSGLALALAGKSPTKSTTATAAASILEHGEQKANEASAQPATSSSPSSTLCYNSGVGTTQPTLSLQHLLSSPRGTYAPQQQHISPTIASGVGGTSTNCKQNNNNLVMGLTGVASAAVFNSPSATQQLQHGLHQQQQTQHSPASPSSASSTSSAIVTTLPTTPPSTRTTTNINSNINLQMGLCGVNSNAAVEHNNSSNVCIGGVIYGSNNNNSTLNCNLNTPSSTTTTTTSCNSLLLNSATTNTAANTNTSSSSSLSPPSSTAATCATTYNNIINNNNTNNNISSNNQNNNNLLSNDNERRDPSPYRCGHCHQVSNWKHVIQRHCRLKHAGDIRIETLDRAAINERANAAPIYRPLGNGASNETNYAATRLPPSHAINALQQQQHSNINFHAHNHNNNNNNNSVLMNKNEHHLMHSPLAAATAAAAVNAANTPQDLQAAAAYLAAALKVATASAPQQTQQSEDFLLQQQLQQNDQIEITRLPATNSSAIASSSNAATNLAHLLEHSGAAAASQQNSKCKQQKCPLCPYISESKSQMNYHISLHKPTQYECPLCTFVCAKKQHLSSHMRSVHHQVNAAANAVGNLDFSVALQLAVAAKAQQDSAAASLTTPLAIDLTSLKSTSYNTATTHSPHHQQQQQQRQLSNATQQQLPPEYQYKMISYCPKCPARFAQKHSEAQKATTELEDHLKAHNELPHSTSITTSYKCEFCDYRAAHETLIQTHRYVHTQHYQDKFNVLFKNCKEDASYAAPKLMQITLTKNLQIPETVWIVDNELSVSEQMKQHKQQPQQQSSNISSSTAGNFDSANSLLKKQLESGPAPLPAATQQNSPAASPAAQESDDCSNTAPSTSASVATSDLAADAGSESVSTAASPAPLEKCLHCPYETAQPTLYKNHLQQHICISNHKEAYNCEHCDYTHADKQHIEEHTRVHFNAMEKLKSVAFFTSYDNLELSVEHENEQQHVDVDTAAENSTAVIEQTTLNIKQEQDEEHNNNNEENAVNENMKAEATTTTKAEASAVATTSPTPAEPKRSKLAPPPAATVVANNETPVKKQCTKIILYKNDGCLSIKRDTTTPTASGNGGGVGNSSSNNSDNISDRLRRRISRSSNSQMNGDDHHHHHNSHHQPSTQQQSHKTILVNAKTGQVISRN